MKKIFTALVLVGSSVLYVFLRTVPVSQTVAHSSAPMPAAPPAMPVSSASVSAKSAYKDGAYIGSMADAYYGTIEVQATIRNGSLADVAFLSYPNDRGTSRFINGQAMPMLTQEAISAQSANVDIISGATDTSLAFRQSLASALEKAHS
ncbi:FMN-binding protein [Patescibacteria group bacterium]|nr:FMN-binding protein [Patescibacteria group bacterium]MDE2173207.1 FMN-binding protein [Patescibacteria group bacterium]